MEDTELEKLDGFVRYYVTAQILGLLSVVGVFYWCFAYGGGFALSGSALFNWHPLFMTIGMLYLLGNCKSLQLSILADIFNQHLIILLQPSYHFVLSATFTRTP